jgi:predicted RNA-binding protein with PIN domain
VRWLVDGMNVIGSRPDGWWRDRDGARARLAEELSRYARETGDDVTVVFDGRPLELGGTAAGADVLFASRSGRDAADDDIARLVEEDADPGSLTVVTSDGELSERARSRGAEVMGAGRFRRQLDGAQPGRGEGEA